MNSPSDAQELQIVRSWQINAKPWVHAIQTGSIASRKLVTDRAIIDTVTSLGPRRVFDVGCGEGWLTRALARVGTHVVGIDVVPELIAAARQGGGEFSVQSFEAIAQGRFSMPPCDVAVCNFSLLGRGSVDSLIGGLRRYLCDPGHLVVQTLHPVPACGNHPYVDGWRAGSWAGFAPEFIDPAPWYFRTLQSWFSLLRISGFDVIECREPTVPAAAAPASVIFVCKARGTEQTRDMGRTRGMEQSG